MFEIGSLAGYFKGEQNEATKVRLNVVPKSTYSFQVDDFFSPFLLNCWKMSFDSGKLPLFAR